MGDILIIGGGFAGLEAARIFSKNRSKLAGRRVIIVDAKKTFDFLPLLPDVCGGRLRKENTVVDLRAHLERLGVNFEHGEAVKIDPEKNEVSLAGGNVLAYEFLILACGSLTNFYGLQGVERRALKLDCSDDASVIQNTVSAYHGKKILIAGGGYTGVEIASHLAVLLRRKRIKKHSVNIIERADDILGSLPEWVRNYCRLNLCSLRVNIFTSTTIDEITDDRVTLSCGTKFDDYLLIWAAGVQTPPFVRAAKFEKDSQGRLRVDATMRFSDRCFAVGDVASFSHKGRPLRMTMQFSVAEAAVAAKNVLSMIAGSKGTARYRPVDIGYLVPMADKKACGKVLVFRLCGLLGWFLNLAMCVCRSLSFPNRLGIIIDALFR